VIDAGNSGGGGRHRRRRFQSRKPRHQAAPRAPR
jgi:hypothetical protein